MYRCLLIFGHLLLLSIVKPNAGVDDTVAALSIKEIGFPWSLQAHSRYLPPMQSQLCWGCFRHKKKMTVYAGCEEPPLLYGPCLLPSAIWVRALPAFPSFCSASWASYFLGTPLPTYIRIHVSVAMRPANLHTIGQYNASFPVRKPSVVICYTVVIQLYVIQ